jgi:post-segregation antitoxin (ccd killing protein)
MNTPTSPHEKTELSVQLDADLVEQLRHLTNDPSKVVEVALRQWLRNEERQERDLSRTMPSNPPVPPRGEWND